MSRPAKVFISYSRDSNTNQERVLDLADRLRGDGIEADIDQYETAPAKGWPEWCERQIDTADFVLMVCTDTYHRQVRDDEASGKGQGVVWEAHLIRQELYLSNANSKKFIPVLFSDGTPDAIPKPVKAWPWYFADTGDGYEALLRRLTCQPWVTRPPLGTARRMPARLHRDRNGDRSGTGTSTLAAITGRAFHWANWPKLLNRGPQETVIVERLDAMARTGHGFEPLLVILPGCAGDCPGHFIERLSWRELQPLLGDERPPVFELEWPESTTDLFAALRDLRNRLDLNPRAVADLPSLADKLSRLAQSFCFHHVIHDHAWHADNGALVSAWIDYFCQAWPKPPHGHLVIAFLCIELPETRSLMARLRLMKPTRSRALFSLVDDLKQRAANDPRLVVAPTMETIGRRDVMSWVNRIQSYVADPALLEDIREQCLAVFTEPHRRYPFEDAHRHLYACLKQVVEPGTRVVTR